VCEVLGRGGVGYPTIILAESQGVARPSSVPRFSGEALGFRQPSIIVVPGSGPLTNSRQPPTTSDGSRVSIIPTPPVVPGGLLGSSPCDDVAVAEWVSDDLEHWSSLILRMAGVLQSTQDSLF
jgi:hypothetical protein